MKKPQLKISDQGEDFRIKSDLGPENNSQSRLLYTGRQFVILKEPEQEFNKIETFFSKKLGLRTACSRDFKTETFTEEKIKDAEAYVYEELGIALIGGSKQEMLLLEQEKNGFFLEPEKLVHIPDLILSTLTTPNTWGLEATQVIGSPYTGKGVKIAVLDTGFYDKHPDFKGREMVLESFVEGENPEDLHGHGTHCIGTACGGFDVDGLRYGIAKESVIYAGKVLNNEGTGAESWVLDGITWAANNGCKVISMSLGSPVLPGEGHSIAYERAARYAISKGAILVAAAGNESNRSSRNFKPIGSPANCPSILAIGAIDGNLKLADFSNRSINPDQMVDLVAPGVDIYSSFAGSTRYRALSGTSMAAPHVAGILALFWEKFPHLNPDGIKKELLQSVQKLEQNHDDIGSGLVIAPSP
jgi:subtilisin family serine protease